MTDDRSLFVRMISSKKIVLTLLVLLMATGLELVIIVEALRGRLSIDDAISKSERVFGIATIAITVTIYAIAKEDAAAKGAPQNVNAGGDVNIQPPRSEPRP